MDNKPLISVIIPIYNCINYLERSISSLFNQSYSNIEIIAIDDGSTDGSAFLLDSISKKDGRMVVVHTNNQGVAAARNVGLSISKGEYIAFLDADDWVSDEYIQELYNLIKKYNVSLATCHSFSVTTSKDNTLPSPFSTKEIVIKYKDYNFKESYSHVVVWGALFEKRILENLSFSPKYGIGEDTVFFAQALKKAGTVVDTNKELYHYSIHNHSLTKGEFTDKQLSGLKAWDTVIDLFFDQNSSCRVSCVAVRAQGVIYDVHLDIKYNGLHNTYINKLASYARKDLFSVLKSNISILDKVQIVFFAALPHLYYFVYYLRILLNCNGGLQE